MKFVQLFLRKSSKYLFDEKGNIVKETGRDKKIRLPWPDAYVLPVLLLGEKALRYARELPQFVPATKVGLEKNGNEISFVIHKRLDLLRKLRHYEYLKKLGFKETPCLANKPFIRHYVDKERKV